MKAVLLIDGKKKCPKCGAEKEVDGFHKSSKKPSGLSSQCKECRNKTIAEWAISNPEKGKERSKKWRKLNPEKSKEQGIAWIKANPEKRKATAARAYEKAKDRLLPAARIRAKAWYEANKDRHVEYLKEWNASNPEKRREYSKAFNRKFRSTPKGNLSSTMSKRMNESLRKGMKAGRHWETLVDFTVDQLKAHLEKLFKPGWTWENYGTVWHVDHKIPVAVFNFERPDDIDFKICWSLKNLQPLEASKNMSKRDKVEKPFQPSLALAAGGSR